MMKRMIAGTCLILLVASAVPAQTPPDRNSLLEGREPAQAAAAGALGYPDPARVLQLATTLRLTDAQRRSLETLRDQTRSRAVDLGKNIAGIEEELRNALTAGLVSDRSLRDDAEQIGRLRGRLSGVYLAARLRTRKLLTADQLDLYRKLALEESSKAK